MGLRIIIPNANYSSVSIGSAIPIQVPITVSVGSGGGGTVSGGGTYTRGETVNISATASRGHVFVRWDDGVTTASRTITVGKTAATYTAIFEVITVETPIINLAGDSATIVIPTGTTVRYTTDGSAPTINSTQYSANTSITLQTNQTLKAVAVQDDVLSAVVSKTYLGVENITVEPIAMKQATQINSTGDALTSGGSTTYTYLYDIASSIDRTPTAYLVTARNGTGSSPCVAFFNASMGIIGTAFSGTGTATLHEDAAVTPPEGTVFIGCVANKNYANPNLKVTVSREESVTTDTIPQTASETYQSSLIGADGGIKDSSTETSVVKQYYIGNIADIYKAVITARNGTGVGTPCISFMDASKNVIGVALISAGDTKVWTDKELNIPSGTAYINACANTRFTQPSLSLKILTL